MSPRKKTNKSNQGFAMTGVLIAATAGLVVALSVSQMLEDMNKTRGAIEYRNHIVDNVEMIRLALITPQFCKFNFVGKVVGTGLDVPALYNPDGTSVFRANPNPEIGGFRITKMTLVPPLTSEDGETFEGKFEVEFSRGAGASTPKKIHRIPFSYLAGSDHKIINCIIAY